MEHIKISQYLNNGELSLDNASAKRLLVCFLHNLEVHIKGIYRVQDLRDPARPERPLYGLLDKQTIYLEHDLDETELLSTLIHELTHYYFDLDESHEQIICKIEEILMEKISSEQKIEFEKYIPKECSNQKPRQD